MHSEAVEIPTDTLLLDAARKVEERVAAVAASLPNGVQAVFIEDFLRGFKSGRFQTRGLFALAQMNGITAYNVWRLTRCRPRFVSPNEVRTYFGIRQSSALELEAAQRAAISEPEEEADHDASSESESEATPASSRTRGAFITEVFPPIPRDPLAQRNVETAVKRASVRRVAAAFPDMTWPRTRTGSLRPSSYDRADAALLALFAASLRAERRLAADPVLTQSLVPVLASDSASYATKSRARSRALTDDQVVRQAERTIRHQLPTPTTPDDDRLHHHQHHHHQQKERQLGVDLDRATSPPPAPSAASSLTPEPLPRRGGGRKAASVQAANLAPFPIAHGSAGGKDKVALVGERTAAESMGGAVGNAAMVLSASVAAEMGRTAGGGVEQRTKGYHKALAPERDEWAGCVDPLKMSQGLPFRDEGVYADASDGGSESEDDWDGDKSGKKANGKAKAKAKRKVKGRKGSKGNGDDDNDSDSDGDHGSDSESASGSGSGSSDEGSEGAGRRAAGKRGKGRAGAETTRAVGLDPTARIVSKYAHTVRSFVKERIPGFSTEDE